MISASVSRTAATVRLITREYPEYLAILLCASAWIEILALQRNGGMLCHVASPLDPAYLSVTTLLGLAASGKHLATIALHWLLMVLAMMLPVQIASLRRLAGRSLWNRRYRNTALALIGYCLPWVAAGCAAELALSLLPGPAREFLPAAALVVAAVWQLAPAKRRTLIRCHPEPLLAPTGWKGDRDCLKFGLLLARRCGMSCWAVMLACAANQHALWAMALASLVLWTERFRPQTKLAWSAAALTATAAVVVVQAAT